MSAKAHKILRLLLLAVVTLAITTISNAASVNTRSLTNKNKSQKLAESQRARRRMSRLARSRSVSPASRRTAVRRRRHHNYERFYTSSYAEDIAEGDVVGGEDPVVRQAAIDALGNMNGTVVAIEPTSGRVLAMVNQKLARSNNAYFEALGRKLGFEKIRYYANEFGLGELAGYNIDGEHIGTYPDAEISAKLGGVGKMCSFGEGISMTPLQLGAMVSAIANGGTLYYAQHPTTPEEIASFQPRVKRHLDIAPLIPEISDGMAGAVLYGTARSLRYNFSEEQVLGKTGTCSRAGTRYGWFASYANTDAGRIVTVVFLQGGRPTFGPKAAEIAGRMYRNLYDHNFFAGKPPALPTDTAGVQPATTTQ